ncbi:hypothetical protein HQ520_06115, partial [bacterium]|nr:hypothetical protein [bacterium]
MFTFYALVWTLLEVFIAGLAWNCRRTPWLSAPLFLRMPWVVMQMYGTWYCVLTGRYDIMLLAFPLSYWELGMQIEIVFVVCFFLAYLGSTLPSRDRVEAIRPWDRLWERGGGAKVLWTFYVIAALAALM